MAADDFSGYRLAAELIEICRSWPGGQFAQLPPTSMAAARSEQLALLRSMPIVADDRVSWENRSIDGTGDEHRIPVRVYRPHGTAGRRPCIVYCHGGAFAMGSVESEHRRTLALAGDLDAVVISVEYRLAPEHPYPAGLSDCRAALAWAAREAASLGVDAARIAMGGASAGGALAAGVALRARDEGGPSIAAQFLIYPALDDRLASESMTTLASAPVFNRADAQHMWKLYAGPHGRVTHPYAAPARATDLSGLPPAYVMTAEYDPLRDEAIEYATRLLRHGVSVELHNVAGAVHGFDVLSDGPLASSAIRAQTEALRRLLA